MIARGDRVVVRLRVTERTAVGDVERLSPPVGSTGTVRELGTDELPKPGPWRPADTHALVAFDVGPGAWVPLRALARLERT